MIKIDQRIKHWFAGYGRVIGFPSRTTLSVAWENGSRGIANLTDCAKARPSDGLRLGAPYPELERQDGP
jgi:hypothetical protein